MYQIALCDDETKELVKIKKMLSEYEQNHFGLEFRIECFENAEELFDRIQEESYIPDLILLDIIMPDKKGCRTSLGIHMAKELRDLEYEGKIIFLTMTKEYALEAFEVNASQYLLKPVEKNKLFSALDRFLKEAEEEQKKYILLRIEGRLVRLAVDDIVCCEAQGKKQCLYLINGAQCTIRMTMLEIYDQLSCYREFVRVGVGFIVNLGYICSLNAKELYMDNGRKIYLPRGAYKGVREQYFNYYCKGTDDK